MIPKIVWMLWFQGWNSAPQVAKDAASTWQLHNHNWDVRLVDRHSLKTYINTSRISTFASLQAQSDLIRLLLLSTYGGVWADATVLCMVSLDSWIPKIQGDFWAHLGTDRGRGPGCTWFLVSSPKSTIIQTWKERAFTFWENRTHGRVTYFWMDNLFNTERRQQPAFSSAWNAMGPRLNCDNPRGAHIVVRNGVHRQASPRVKQLLRECVPRVIKLSHKYGSMYKENETNGQYALKIANQSKNRMCTDEK